MRKMTLPNCGSRSFAMAVVLMTVMVPFQVRKGRARTADIICKSCRCHCNRMMIGTQKNLMGTNLG